MGNADTPAKRAYTAAYQKENTINFAIRLSKIYDADVIRCLEEQANKAGFVKSLIRDYIEKKA